MSATLTAQSCTQPMTFAHDLIGALLKDFPADKVTFQATKADNHALWTLGHLAMTDHWFLSMLKSIVPGLAVPKPLPESWSTLFGYKSVPNPSPSAYPPYAEVRAAFEAGHKSLVAALNSMSEAQRAQPVGEAGAGFVSDANDMIVKATWHLGWHGGQLATLRRALGLPPVM